MKKCTVLEGAYVAIIVETKINLENRERLGEELGQEEGKSRVHLGKMHTLRVHVLYRLLRWLTVLPMVLTFLDSYGGKLAALH